MNKFSDYAKQEGKRGNKEYEAEQIRSDEDAFELLKEIADKYEGATEGQLISAILNEAKAARREGRLSDEEIENFVAIISPMLSDEQRKQLSKVIRKIKKA